MLNRDNTALVVIDVQGNLALAMHQRDSLFENLKILIQGAKILGLPIILTEQLPNKLGSTIDPITQLLPEIQPVAKASFSCCGEPAFMTQLQQLTRSQLLITGIETHVCVYQTALDLIFGGYDVHVVTDAVGSRVKSNQALGIAKMKDAGATLTSVEMALFEIMRIAEGPAFKQIVRLLK